MNRDKLWNAVVNCDKTFDGTFFYGVKTTKIFCRPSCRSKTPLKENITILHSAEEAAAKGFRPCKRCRPNLSDYRPVQELTEKIRNVYDKYYQDRDLLETKLSALHISDTHIIRLFQNEFGTTPAKYLSELRIKKAKELLSGKTMTVTAIAYECGFNSLSAFYDNFKRYTGMTVAEFRASLAETNPHSGSKPA